MVIAENAANEVNVQVPQPQQQPKVFDYDAKAVKESPIILSRNILEHVSHKYTTYKISPKLGSEKGFSKLFKFFTEESYSWRDTRNNDVSISMSNLWKPERHKPSDPPFELDSFDSHTSMNKLELEMKFTKETHDFHTRSTNLASTIEATSGEKLKASFKNNSSKLIFVKEFSKYW